ncbi:MAG: outer membrane lipoprotein carrier protein LolA [Verrucomicrobia bacterium]|nr:outer membrane lipoprotein carrier protein LolA [Verrucomicrobiota bacterium]
MKSPPRPSAGSVITALSLLLIAVPCAAQSPDETLDRWLTAQAGLTSWTAQFTQVRHLQALTQPLSSPGRVWFQAPDQFRWELGDPAKSIALRNGTDLWMLSPALKRAEQYPLDARTPGPMKDALTLLDSGFPRDGAEFRRRFELLELVTTNAQWRFRLRPRAAASRRLLPALTLEVRTNDLALAASELQFTDGSRLRNEFHDAERNPDIPASLFAPGLDRSWKITRPEGPR